ncbi:MAG: orotate phosphoribosyltransferase [Chromatiales bacterium]|nr:orotate phosphoribosyltransferase [Chromatiales bacterium]
MLDHQRRFLDLAFARDVLRFGEFKLKSGRLSPYFFNAGRFDSGASLGELARCYADAIVASGIGFDLLFGPAYKGIPLAAAVALAFEHHHGRDVPYAYDRKEAKDHGEGGSLVGAPVHGRVLIIDDVVTAGTAARGSIEKLRAAGAEPVALAVALDRQERGTGERSAIQELRETEGIDVIAVADLDALIEYARDQPQLAAHLPAIEAYRGQYGVSQSPVSRQPRA